jgi:hypothetical protein
MPPPPPVWKACSVLLVVPLDETVELTGTGWRKPCTEWSMRLGESGRAEKRVGDMPTPALCDTEPGPVWTFPLLDARI